MALLDYLKEMDPERAKIAARLSNIRNIPYDGAAKAVAPVVEKSTPILESLNKPLDLIKGIKKAGGVTGNVVNKAAPVLLNPTVMRGAGVVQAGFGVADAARNGVNLQNATDIAAGGLQTYNPALGVPLNTGILGGKLLATGADKLGLLDPLKPKPAVQGPAFAAAQTKFNADPRPQDIGFVAPKYPTPQIAFSADQIAAGDIPQAQFTGAELAAMQRDATPSLRSVGGVGGGGSRRTAAPSLAQEPVTATEDGVIVDRGGVQSLDNFYGDRNYTLPNESPENRAANMMKLLSNTAQEAYNDTTIRTETLDPVQGVDRFGNPEIQYVRKTNVTPGLNIASPLQQQIAGVAPIPYAERVAAAKNAADIEQQQIQAAATTGSARITADASERNNRLSVDGVRAQILLDTPPEARAAMAQSFGVSGSASKGADKFTAAFNDMVKDLDPDQSAELYSYINAYPNATMSQYAEIAAQIQKDAQNKN